MSSNLSYAATDSLFTARLASPLTVAPATKESAPEVLRFLAERPLHTVAMGSLIHDNGMVSPFNRGTFFVCRDGGENIKGVALFGHNTSLEARSPAVTAALARRARENELRPRRIMGEEHTIQDFWKVCAAPGQKPRYTHSELLLELNTAGPAPGPAVELRLASQHDLEDVIVSHAEVAYAESGVNPLAVDPAGFAARALRRVVQQRTWVVSDCGRLIFKAELAAATPGVAYLEGVYVNPQERGKGWGLRCLTQLSRQLLAGYTSICLLVNEQNVAARKLYHKAGYAPRARYQALCF